MRTNITLLFSIGSLFALAAASFAISLPHNRNRHADLIAVPAVIDLGSLRQEQAVDSQFQLQNKCSEHIEIVKIASSCGCTIVQSKKSLLLPGERCEIPFRYHSGESSGKVSKPITVHYRRANSREATFLNLEFSAIIAPDFRCAPSSLRFEDGVPCTADISVDSDRFPDFSLADASATVGSVRTTVCPPVTRKNSWRIKVQYTPDNSPFVRQINAQIILQASCAGRRARPIRVPVIVSPKGTSRG